MRNQDQEEGQEYKMSYQIDKTKVTPSMLSSLETIRNCLLCPLCNQVMKQPSTLQCSHSFCKGCIADHTRHSWTCPFPSCQLPVSNRGKSKSYISINPQIASVISSYGNIMSSLDSASPEWWKQNSKRISTTNEISFAQKNDITNNNYNNSNALRKRNHSDHSNSSISCRNMQVFESAKKRAKGQLHDIVEDDIINISSDNERDDSNDQEPDENGEDGTQKYSIKEIEDQDETQQYSIDDTTEPYSIVDDHENDNNNDNDNNNGSQYERIIQVDSDNSFTNSPPLATKNVTTRCLGNNCGDTKNLLGTSPKLSPIATVGSQSSTTASTTSTGIASTTIEGKNLTSSMIDSNNKGIIHGSGYVSHEKQPLSFMTLFKSLLHKLDTTNDDDSQLNCNNKLLEQYRIYLVDDGIDPEKQEGISMNRGSNIEPNDYKSFTRGRICLLLRLCGAEVKNLTSIIATSTTRSKGASSSTTTHVSLILVLGSTNLSLKSQEQIKNFSQRSKRGRGKNAQKAVPIVSCQWFLDTLSDFEIKKTGNYILM